MKVFRIMPSAPRSAAAIASHADLDIFDVPTVRAVDDSLRAREIACSMAHAGAVRAFLDTGEPFAAVIEDDAIFTADRAWLEFTEFDLFFPFGSNRYTLPPNATIRRGVVPKFGAFAYLLSREFALRYLPRLEAGEVSDHAHHRAAAGLRIGSFAGNVVIHDNHAPSTISERRRRYFLGRAHVDSPASG